MLWLVACSPVPVAVAVVGGFQSPVGPPDGAGYYDAQPFGENEHLGSDLNGRGGGNTDLGDPVFAAARGTVVFADDLQGGWGNVVRLVHALPDGASVETVYAHLDRIDVAVGDDVPRGAEIGTIGTAHGRYKAHLHFEVRTTVGAAIGGGYGAPEQGQVDPTAFVAAH